jgi:fused signal recognition particle receptor
VAEVTVDGVTVESNTRSEDEIRANLAADVPKKDAAPAEGKPEAKSESEAEGAEVEAKSEGGERERNPDGTFKAAAGDKPSDKAEDKDKLGKPRHDPRARMLEATRKEAEAKREAAALASELAQLRGELESLRQSAKPKPERPAPHAAAPDDDPADPKPRSENFEEYEDFVDARARWAARQELSSKAKENAAKQAAQRGEEAKAQRFRTFAERWQKAAEANPEFVDRVKESEVGNVRPVSAYPREEWSALPAEEKARAFVAEEIISSDVAPRLLLHLSEHPEEFQRIASLPPHEVVRQIAILETRLNAAPAGTAQAEVSKAKPPIRPVMGSPHTATDEEPDDPDAYIAWANARDRRRTAAR